MDEQSPIQPMKPVRSQDAIPDPGPFGSTRRALTSIATLVVTWIAIFIATQVLHLPAPLLVGLGIGAVVVLVGIDVVRWHRRRSR